MLNFDNEIKEIEEIKEMNKKTNIKYENNTFIINDIIISENDIIKHLTNENINDNVNTYILDINCEFMKDIEMLINLYNIINKNTNENIKKFELTLIQQIIKIIDIILKSNLLANEQIMMYKEYYNKFTVKLITEKINHDKKIIEKLEEKINKIIEIRENTLNKITELNNKL